MAANFGDTMFDGGIAPEVQVQTPVQDNSAAILGESLGTAAKQVGSIFGSFVKAGIQGQSNAVLTSYRQDLLKLADVASQRGDTAAVQMRARALYSQYLANNPSLAGDLDKVNSELLGANGLAHVISTGSAAAQAQEAVTTAAVTNGWVADVNDPTQVAAGVANYQSMQVDVQKAEALQRQLDVIKANGGIIDETHRQEAVQVVRSLGKSGYPWVKAQVDTARQRLDAGGNAAEIVAQLKADYAEQSAAYTTLAEGQDMAWVLDPMKQLVDNFEAYATGSVELSVFEAQNKGIKARQEFALRSDPELGQLLTTSELLGTIGTMNDGLLARTTQATNNFLARSLQPYDPASDTNAKPNDPVGTPDGDVKAGLDLITTGIKAANGPASTPALVQETATSITNTVRGISAYSGSAESAKDFKDAVNWLATPDMGTFMETNGGVPTAIAQKARDVIKVQYEEVLLPLVKERWDSAMLSIPDPAGGTTINSMGSASTPSIQVKASEVIQPVWNGTSVQFIPKPGYENNIVVAGTARSMNTGNNSVAEPLNTLIRAKAHLNGTKDYQAEWESVFGDRLFGIGSELANKVNAALDATAKPAEGVAAPLASVDLSTFNEATAASYIDLQAGTEDTAPDATGTEGAVKGFEGFSSKPYWDVNAYRVGFGSDTITQADGTVVRVTPGMSVTREDAQRDLTRRLNTEFIPGIIKDVGPEAWAPLPAPVKTALASIAYNYGSIGPDGANLTAAIKSGDLETIAQAIERLKTHNGGVNAKRRQAEADMVRNALNG